MASVSITTFGLEAHSDGDVLIHAICDAILGAAGLGTSGGIFPIRMSSTAESTVAYCCVACATPSRRMACGYQSRRHYRGPGAAHGSAHPGHVRESGPGHGVAQDRVNVKATTTERMGYTGRGEGIAAHAVVLLVAI